MYYSYPLSYRQLVEVVDIRVGFLWVYSWSVVVGLVAWSIRNPLRQASDSSISKGKG